MNIKLPDEDIEFVGGEQRAAELIDLLDNSRDQAQTIVDLLDGEEITEEECLFMDKLRIFLKPCIQYSADDHERLAEIS